MATENANTPRKTSLLEYFLPERTAEMRSDLENLFATLHGDELLEAVIERLQRYAIEGLDESALLNFRKLQITAYLRNNQRDRL